MERREAFTLIELLIVVAIIGILAAIAVPNFLNAQTRAKIARAHGDLRALDTALQSYHIDRNVYPILGSWQLAHSLALQPLTTPITYIASVEALTDPFKTAALQGVFTTPPYHDDYLYSYYKLTGKGVTWADVAGVRPEESRDACVIWTVGPSQWLTSADWYMLLVQRGQIKEANDRIYRASNGLVSKGSIPRFIGDTRGTAATLNL